ncbi:MICOS complex subunit MIC25 isoform X2 [Lithobates pipiens]
MGGSESTGRKVSFGLDEEDRVRVLRGVRLTDDLVSRMKESSPQRGEQNLLPTLDHPPPPQSSLPKGGPEPSASDFQSKTEGTQGPSAGGSKKIPTYAEDELYRRYEREQAIIQEALARLSQREHEAAQEKFTSAILREKNYTNQERRRAEQLAKELQRKEEELKKLDSFHKEQLTSIEKKLLAVGALGRRKGARSAAGGHKKRRIRGCSVQNHYTEQNLEIYKLTAEQFHTAATNAELRVKKRSYDPVCQNLQSNILKCYSENQQELLNCSDLAKEYQSCVREAQKIPCHWCQFHLPPSSISDGNFHRIHHCARYLSYYLGRTENISHAGANIQSVGGNSGGILGEDQLPKLHWGIRWETHPAHQASKIRFPLFQL